ncbi:hypothetical protein H7F33_13905 [Pedobacter sp. PAMC26386]|nr:hypothetical protein H7F33_13905 [Pedobacter sp. PAMC26386]
MNNLMAIICLFFLLRPGCDQQPGSAFIDTLVRITYTNSVNADMLDPSGSNAIKVEDIEIYYLEKGVKRRVFNPNLDLPKNLTIEKRKDGRYQLRIMANEVPDRKGISTTYIEIKNRRTDTLTTALITSASVTRVIRVWYNGRLMWDGKGIASFNIID